jgi:integrase
MRGHNKGSVFQRNDGRWAVTLSLGNGKRKTWYASTQKEAKELRKKLLYELQQGSLVITPKQTVGQFLTTWLEGYKYSVKPRTYEKYEGMLRVHLLPGIGNYQLGKLAPYHLERFYTQKIEGGLAASTVIGLHKMLHLALDKAVRWGMLPYNVCDRVTPPRAKRYESHPLTPEQIQRFLDAAEGHRLEALFVLALATGLRRGELLALKWQDIDFEEGKLQVRRIWTRMPAALNNGKGGYVEAEPKTESGRRSVIIAPFALEKLRQHRSRQLEAKLKAGPAWKENDLVFCSSVGGHLHTGRDVFTQLKRLLDLADLPDIRFHDLRHSTATLLLKKKVHPKVVQEILGHAQIGITMNLYSHVLPGIQEEAINELNAVLQGQQKASGKRRRKTVV